MSSMRSERSFTTELVPGNMAPGTQPSASVKRGVLSQRVGQ